MRIVLLSRVDYWLGRIKRRAGVVLLCKLYYDLEEERERIHRNTLSKQHDAQLFVLSGFILFQRQRFWSSWLCFLQALTLSGVKKSPEIWVLGQ